ncbi:MAG: ABC transporter ATP-binding protein [Acidobacteria bacterium]|nr:ABC transporter ATP-binding protein [Acidobacteriota bacterium]MCI0720596.1 ABC transporter ATP-binding protein [Acidobacteriota bacterium]
MSGLEREIAISVRKVGKVYRIYDRPEDRLRQMLFARFGKSYGRDFCALRDVSFEVYRREALGIIGRNGSGKSTLLQILAGTLSPTWGEVKVQGRVAALLELGSGFNPEFTGRENVYLNASLLGMTKKQTDARFDEIASFAEIGDFIDQPVKTYSSGMVIRLAFAVQTAIEPEILIIDEALSVGDFFFQQKCARRMRELREKGTTLLFVSHDMAVVRDLCQQVVYLRKGELAYFGNSTQAIQLYFQEDGRKRLVNSRISATASAFGKSQAVEKFNPLACWTGESSDNAGKKDARILGVALLDEQRHPTSNVTMGQELLLWVMIEHLSAAPIDVSVAVKNRYDQIVSSFGSYTLGLTVRKPPTDEVSFFKFKMSVMIEAGLYTFRVILAQSGASANQGFVVDGTPWLGPLAVSWDYENHRAPFLGMFGIPVSGKICDPEEAFGLDVIGPPPKRDAPAL